MTVHIPSRTSRAIAALATSLVLVSGCSAGGGTATGSSTTGPTGAAAPSAAGVPSEAAGSAKPGGAIDVCQVITVADVEALFTGSSVTATTVPNDPSACSYSFQPEGEGFSIKAATGDQAAMFWAGSIPPQGDYSIALTGIGSQAMREPGYPNLASTSGSIFCEIDTSAGATELYGGLATPDTNDHVPDDAATAIAQKLGTLCNKILASQ